MFALIAFEPVGHPKQRAEDRGAIVAGQVYDTGFNYEAAEFDEMTRPLAAFDLPCAHVMSRPFGLMSVVCRPVAQERRQRRGQLLEQFAAIGSERTRPRAWTMPPSFRSPSSRLARSARPPIQQR